VHDLPELRGLEVRLGERAENKDYFAKKKDY
jgi:hypothetical protein